jgi:hypothetical protein
MLVGLGLEDAVEAVDQNIQNDAGQPRRQHAEVHLARQEPLGRKQPDQRHDHCQIVDLASRSELALEYTEPMQLTLRIEQEIEEHQQ